MTTSAIHQLRAYDPADMLGAVGQIPDHLADGLARSRAVRGALAHVWPSDGDARPPRALVVCGMGGSGVGADLLQAAADTAAPVICVKGYDLPAWVLDEDRVVCVSYSGATAETLACYRAARTQSVVAAVITTGGELGDLARADGVPVVELPTGLQPRAAVGLLFGALAGVAGMLNVVDDAAELVEHSIDGARIVVEQHDEFDGSGARAFAEQLFDKVIVVYGAGSTEAVAHRWKAQVNENGKVPCFANAYPELDHNEIVGWEFARATGARWAVVELLPFEAHASVRTRFDITRELIADEVDCAIRFEPRASRQAGAVFEQLAWGDYISVYLALQRGIDPTPVERIQSLKGRLAGR